MSNACDHDQRVVDRSTRNSAYLLRMGIADAPDEVGDLVAHGLGCDTGSGSLEVELTLTTHAMVLAAGHEGVHGEGAARETMIRSCCRRDEDGDEQTLCGG